MANRNKEQGYICAVRYWNTTSTFLCDAGTYSHPQPVPNTLRTFTRLPSLGGILDFKSPSQVRPSLSEERQGCSRIRPASVRKILGSFIQSVSAKRTHEAWQSLDLLGRSARFLHRFLFFMVRQLPAPHVIASRHRDRVY